MLNFNVLYIGTSFIPYADCTALSNLIYLPIFVNIINVITLSIIKEPFKEHYLLIYLIISVLIYILNLFTLPILMLISIITILMCLINRIIRLIWYILWLTDLITVIYCVTEEQFPFLM